MNVLARGIQMSMQRFTRYFADIVVLLLIAVLLVAVPLLRSNPIGNIGSESYFLERMAQSLPYYDTLSYSGRAASFNRGTPLLMSFIPESYWNYFAFGVTYLVAVLFWLLLRKFNVEKRWMALLLFALTPTSLYLASAPNR